MSFSRRFGAAILAAAVAYGTMAQAYPTSVLRTPTGDTKGFADLNLLVASSYLTSPPRLLDGRRSTTPYPGATRIAQLVGLVPQFSYGQGLQFGGLEAGVDLLSSDAFGNARLKPLFGAKLGLLVEGRYHPYAAVGVMELSNLDHQSLNFGYVSLTKTLAIRSIKYGRFTLGLGRSFAANAERYPANCPASTDDAAACMFRGTYPFAASSPFALLFGYESPKWGPLLLAFDHTGGHSSVSSTNLGVKLFMSERITASVVRFWGNIQDQSTLEELGTREAQPVNGLIVGISATANFVTLFYPESRKE